MRAAGGEIREIDGSFDDAHLEARRLAAEEGFVNVNSINPDRIEGQSRAAVEVVEQLGAIPDVLALPFGGGGNTVAYAQGFTGMGHGERLPRFLLGEAARRRDTFASAIRIVEPVHRAEVDGCSSGSAAASSRSRRSSSSTRGGCSCGEEGLFCEPASAAGIAAVEASASSRARGSSA